MRVRNQLPSVRHSDIRRRHGFTRNTLRAHIRCASCGRDAMLIFPCKWWRKGHLLIPCACGARSLEAVPHGVDG